MFYPPAVRDFVLDVKKSGYRIDIDDPEKIPLMKILGDKGVMLYGRLPIWLFCAVARQLAKTVPWIAVYQPNNINAGMVVYSQETAVPIGTIIPNVIGN